MAEDYHRRIVEAHKGRGVEQLTLPVLRVCPFKNRWSWSTPSPTKLLGVP